MYIFFRLPILTKRVFFQVGYPIICMVSQPLKSIAAWKVHLTLNQLPLLNIYIYKPDKFGHTLL